MENLEFTNYGLEALSQQELHDTEGGFWWLIVPGIIVGGVLVFAGAGLYALAEAGYQQA